MEPQRGSDELSRRQAAFETFIKVQLPEKV